MYLSVPGIKDRGKKESCPEYYMGKAGCSTRLCPVYFKGRCLFNLFLLLAEVLRKSTLRVIILAFSQFTLMYPVKVEVWHSPCSLFVCFR